MPPAAARRCIRCLPRCAVPTTGTVLPIIARVPACARTQWAALASSTSGDEGSGGSSGGGGGGGGGAYAHIYDKARLLGLLAFRGVAAYGMTHAVTEYGVEITLCEGPSMLPTIRPAGELILMERMSHRWYGIDGGSDGERRAALARAGRLEGERRGGKRKVDRASNPTCDALPTPVDALPTGGLAPYRRLWSRLTSGIARGDVVVLDHPLRAGTVCKRVVGLPGDTVVLASSGSVESVPDGHLWVEGDNSRNSADSRHYGAIPASLVMGKVVLRLWPLRGPTSWIERGGRPASPGDEPCSGCIVLPAGIDEGNQLTSLTPER